MRIAIIGGGPAGYEAALVAVQLGAEVTLVDRDGAGGACVLWDCVPSKTLIATSELMTQLAGAHALGVDVGDSVRGGWGTGHDAEPPDVVDVDIERVYARVRHLALAQSTDIARRLTREGVTLLQGAARLVAPNRVKIRTADGAETGVEADVVLIATGATPRVLAGSEPDGERILSWRQLYDLPELPEHLVVVGSGVTGAEFAGAFRALGSRVTLVSSRDRVLPGQDPDAADLIEDVFRRRGIEVVKGVRASGVRRTEKGVAVDLGAGEVIEGSHCLLAIGSIPQTSGLHLSGVGVATTPNGYVTVDRVSRTNVPGIYAAGDCTGVLPLASVAAMQGRIAMWHALGEAVAPLRLSTVSANVFTDPEIATVGVQEAQVASGAVNASTVKLALSTNARAKMQGVSDGFVKLFCRPGAGTVLGGVVVAPKASELVMPISIAVQNGLTADQVAHTFSIYPSMSGSLAEAARQLMVHAED